MPRTDNFHSEEIQEIMGRTPSWVVRWGITVLFVILVSIILGCYFIRSPRIVTGPIIVSSIDLPSELIAGYGRLIDTVCIRNSDVVPEGKTEFIGRMQIPIESFGEVKIGQPVHVKLAGFPYMEYGIVKGTIRSVVLISQPQQNTAEGGMAYQVEIIFPEGMKTAYGKELPSFIWMAGTGEIITENQRLIERFIQPVRHLFKN